MGLDLKGGGKGQKQKALTMTPHNKKTPPRKPIDPKLALRKKTERIPTRIAFNHENCRRLAMQSIMLK